MNTLFCLYMYKITMAYFCMTDFEVTVVSLAAYATNIPILSNCNHMGESVARVYSGIHEIAHKLRILTWNFNK